MKKLLSILMLFLASFALFIFNVEPAFATVEEDYHDLFYQSEVVGQDPITETARFDTTISESYGTVSNYDPSEITALSEALEASDWDHEIITSIKIQQAHGSYELYTPSADNITVTEYEIRIEFTGDITGYFTVSNGSFGYAGFTDGIYFTDDNGMESAEFRVEWIDDYEDVYGDVLIPFDKSYSYGRVRSNVPDVDLMHDPVNGEVYLVTEGNTVLDLEELDFEGTAEFVLQSPYSDFRVYSGNSSNINRYNRAEVSAVVISFRKTKGPNADWHMDVDSYYWEDGIIKRHSTENVSIPLNQGYNLRVFFYGGLRQAISAEEHMVANVDELVDLESFLDYVVAWDDIYGDISDQVFIEDDGGYENDVVGIYDVVFGVTDAEGQTSYLEVTVHVVDIVAPVISGTTTKVTISYHQDFNVANWVSSLSVTDNYYTGLTITIHENTYSSNKTAIGEYEVTVKAVDGSGNIGYLTREIEVVDGVAPVFTGPTEITASITEGITADQIKSTLAAIDAKDGNVTESITIDSDTLTGDENQPGEYTVVFMAEDSAGNQSFHTVTVTIVSAPPGFYLIDGKSIRLLPGSNLTVEQILNLLGVEDAQELSTNYAPENGPGIYQLSFTFNDEAFDISITVLGVDDNPLPLPVIPEEPADFSWLYWVLGGLAVAAFGTFVLLKRRR